VGKVLQLCTSGGSLLTGGAMCSVGGRSLLGTQGVLEYSLVVPPPADPVRPPPPPTRACGPLPNFLLV